MGSHITRMLFALHTHCSNGCKDDLMMVSWPKYVVKVKIKKEHILLCLTGTLTICFHCV